MQSRGEVTDQDKWDVDSFFSGCEAWEKAFTKFVGKDPKNPWPELRQWQGRLGQGAKEVHDVLSLQFALSREAGRLYTYAHLRNDEDVANDLHKGMYQRAISIYQLVMQEIAWVEPELLELDEKVLEAYVSAPELIEYRFYLEDVARRKRHTLSASEERLVAMAGEPLTCASRAFSMLENADMRFGSVRDSKGKEHELTLGSYSVMLRDPDRVLRQNAFEQMHDRFKGYQNTLGELLCGQVQTHRFYASSHRFDTCIESALYANNIDTKVYQSLIESVHQGLDKLHHYFDVKKQILGLDALHLYDAYAPISHDTIRDIPYGQAVKDVARSVHPLGEEYQNDLAKGLGADQWVDRYENEGKRSGAYSSGCYDSHPYILMNYKGDLNDVFTLAHEAGHSMHSLLSRKNQPYHYSDYSIFVAEVASTFNEALLMHQMMQGAKNAQEKIVLLDRKLEGLRATLFRQTMFAEFELYLHSVVEQGMALTPAGVSEKYYELNKLYFGPGVVIDDSIAIEWSRIPHFYYNYYVYQYATGISAAETLAKHVLQGGKKERDAYLGFLKGGSSGYPIDLLKGAGVDVTTTAPVDEALAVFGSLTDELEKLYQIH